MLVVLSETSMPIAVHLTLTASLYLFSSESNERGKIELSVSSSRSPSGVQIRDKGVAGRNKREQYAQQ